MRVAPALLLLAVGGCAFDDGQPWGLLQPTLTAVHERPDDRLDEDGRFITANDYALEIETVELQLERLVFELDGSGAGSAAFDPAQPPPGYSLCHNGHCHAADGSLVAYADIEAELAQQSGGGAAITLITGADVLALSAEPVEVELGPCPNGCFVERGELLGVRVHTTRLKVVGRAFDRLTGDAQRLPDEGVPVELDVALALAARGTTSAVFGREDPVTTRVQTALVVPAQLFDGVDFSSPLGADAETSVVESFAQHVEVRVTIVRLEDN